MQMKSEQHKVVHGYIVKTSVRELGSYVNQVFQCRNDFDLLCVVIYVCVIKAGLNAS